MPHRPAAFAALAAALALAAAGPAGAVTALTFTTPGAAEPSIYLAGYAPGTTEFDAALHSTFALSLLSTSADGYQWNFGYTLDNTSTEASRLATIGWDVSADVVGLSGLSGTFGQSAQDGQMASLGTLDVCLKATGGAGCSGGGSGGLVSGQAGSGLFSLTFQSSITTYTTVQTPVYSKRGRLTGYTTSTVAVVTPVAAPTSVTFNDFGAHYQALPGGFSTVGVAAEMPPPPGKPLGGELGSQGLLSVAVPEPATWALMILGFGGVGAVLRRRHPDRLRLSRSGLG
jgi:hypothetical protein